MDIPARQTFHKSERLCRSKLITEIFRSGEIFYSNLFRVGWIFTEGSSDPPAQVAISVPKKCIRLAVTRNLIRRRIREAYRRDKQELYDCLSGENVSIAFIIIYSRNSVSDYPTIDESVREVISKLCAQVRQKSVK